MNPKMEKAIVEFNECFATILSKIKMDNEHIKDLENKIYFLISEKLDFTFLQIKEERDTCNIKELKKASAILKEAIENTESFNNGLLALNYFDNSVYLNHINQEYENSKEQELSSHYCLIAQNLHTKEYARLIFEDADEDFEEGFNLLFSPLRCEATEITKISESPRSIDYIQKLLTIDFPEIEWKVFKSARIKGRNLTPYPVY